MKKNLLKIILWMILGITAFALTLGLVRGLGSLVVYFQNGADPASALNITPNSPPDWSPQITWLDDDSDIGRKMEPVTRMDIQNAYVHAWLQIYLSDVRGEPYGLNTYFSGPGLANVTERVLQNAGSQFRVEQIDTAHHLQLHFYSADGSIVAFTDRYANLAQVVRDTTGNITNVDEVTNGFQVVMRLEDGRWQVRHWVRTETTWTPQTILTLGDDQLVQIEANNLILQGQVYRVRGINYYPAHTPWRAFWENYDPQVVERDLALINSLGLNTIRIFVPFDVFGGSKLEPGHVDHLRDVLARANTNELKVIVTLFDFRTDYNPARWFESDRHLQEMLNHFKDDPAILAWDIKNEPDLDYPASGKPLVNAWLNHTISLARRNDPNHLLTIGWSNYEAAATLSSGVDFLSFHYYAPTDELPRAYDSLRQSAPDKPIVLTEFGLPTWNSFFFPNGHDEAEQASYYSQLLHAIQQTDSAGYMAWTLNDFNTVPPGVAGHWPWETGPQKHMGIYRLDGSPKPAAEILSSGAQNIGPIYPIWRRFLKPFWIMFSILLIGGGIFAAHYKRKIIS